MKRRRIAVFMALVLAVQMLPLPAGAMEGLLDIVSRSEAAALMSGTDGSITWKVEEEVKKDGWDLKDVTPCKLTITGTGKMPAHPKFSGNVNGKYVEESTAPWKDYVGRIQTISIGSGITEISNGVFYGCSALSVDIPSTVTGIGYGAFEACTILKGATLPSGLTSIGSSAFSGCKGMEAINIPGSVASIGSSAFSSCSKLKKVTISEGTKVIGFDAFSGCTGLSELSLPKASLTTLQDGCFSFTALKEFYVPASVSKIPSNPYVGGVLEKITVAPGNPYFKVVNNMLVELKDSKAYRVVCYPYKEAVNVEVPAPVEVIGQRAFCRTQIEKVDLPPSLLEIQAEAFDSAVKLPQIEIPGNVKYIRDSAFYYCTSLKDVVLGGDLLSIGTYAFGSCRSICEIHLPDKLQTVGWGTFSQCTKLKEMEFPSSVETIGSSALSGCTSLEKVSLGRELKTISGNVFQNCPKLAEIALSPKNTYMMAENNVLYNIGKTKLIYYAAGLPDEKFLIPETVTAVGEYAFAYTTKLKELRFPETVASLERYAIYWNSNLAKLLFYGNAPTVTESASHETDSKNNITGCTAYNASVCYNKVGGGSYDNKGMTVHIVDGTTGWENSSWFEADAASAHKNHTGYKWGANYTKMIWDPAKTDVGEGNFGGLTWSYRDDIGELTFSGSGKIPDFTRDNLEKWSNDPAVNHRDDIKLIELGPAAEVGNNTFYGMKNLVRILSGDELERIGESAFADCTKLSIVHVQGAATIEKEAFQGDTAILDELDVRGAETIGEGAFKGCTGMTDILLGESLEALGKEAFMQCGALETLILPESLESLGEGCFRGCRTLRTLNIPKGVSVMPANCFADCTGFRKIYFYGDRPGTMDATAFMQTHEDMTIYYRKGNSTWDALGSSWQGIPVEGLDKFYTEREDHYSFSNSKNSFGYDDVYYIPRQRYITALQSIVRGSYYYAWDKGWNGSCFGMAASTTEFYQGDEFDLKDYSSTAETLYGLGAPRSSNAAITKLIEVYQVSQYVDEIGWEISNTSGEYRKLIKQVEEFERSGGLNIDSEADPIIMCIYAERVGHAVVPVAVNMDAEGNYILDVYDCNAPSGLRKLTIKKDFSGIDYVSGFVRYNKASFVKYSTVRDALAKADFTGENFQKPSGARSAAGESTKVSIAVNREKVELVNGGGKDYKEIKGAYEQTPMSDGIEEFSGVRSFVLPQGEYKIQDESEAGSQTEDLKYYVATEDLFSEIETSDKDAELTVKSVKGTGYDTVTLSSEKADTETELTVMDVSGIKKEITVKGSDVSFEIVDDSEMKLSVSEDASSVKVDGKELALSEGRANVSFYASEGDNPMEASDMVCEFSLDDRDRLSGKAEAYITWKKEAAQDVDVTTKLKDEEGNVIAEYEKKINLRLGMQKVNVSLDKVRTNLSHLSGDFQAVCEMTLVDAGNNKVIVTYSDIALKAAQKTPTESPTPKPTETPTPTPTNTPTPTPKPTGTPAPTNTATPTPKPTGSPDVTEELPVQTAPSLPQKGKVKTVGALKYIVLKSAKKNGTVAVYGAKKKNIRSVSIPEKVKIGRYSFKVVSIYKNAFSKNTKLSMVTMGANIKSIGDNAFKNCKRLEFVLIPGKVTAIGKKAFAGCGRLRYLVVRSDTVKSVGSKAFQGVSPKMKVKTSKGKWRKYSKMFTKKGKMPQRALYLIEPVKIKYRGKSY